MQNQGMTQPTFGGFGMAGGGVIETEQTDGAFSMKPTQPTKASWLIGEGKHGEGLAAGTAEVLTVEQGPFGIKSVEVTPLAGAAQGGLNVGVSQALEPLFGSFGPTFARPAGGVAGKMGEISVTDFGSLSRLGVTPQFVREIETGKVYVIQGGVRRYMSSPETMGALGVQPSSIINAYASEIARMAPTEGEVIYTPSGFPSPNTGGYGAIGAPLIESTTGAMLSAPHRIASLLNRWQQGRPDLFANAMSAYGNVLDPVTGGPFGGISPESIQSIMKTFTPQSRGGYAGYNPQRIGFTGAQY